MTMQEGVEVLQDARIAIHLDSLLTIKCDFSGTALPSVTSHPLFVLPPFLLPKALKACLMLVEKRETRYRVQWYYKLFEQTMRGGLSRDHKSGAMPNAGQ